MVSIRGMDILQSNLPAVYIEEKSFHGEFGLRKTVAWGDSFYNRGLIVLGLGIRH